jgi:hypothetical protein
MNALAEVSLTSELWMAPVACERCGEAGIELLAIRILLKNSWDGSRPCYFEVDENRPHKLL